MPDKPITVITYAASASLAAIALVYFFNPNYLIDGSDSASARRKGVVGLQNPMNDCFINSVLQALAGLGDLRLYLIRELHRRKLSDPQIYRTIPEQEDGKPLNKRKALSLQGGEVTFALKQILDQLNEKPIYKKTISAGAFIAALERALDTRISKDQQDAQELLQVVAQSVCDEYHAGNGARKRARKDISRKSSTATEKAEGLGLSHALTQNEQQSLRPSTADVVNEPDPRNADSEGLEEEAGFPLEGQTQSLIECQHCHFIPKSKPVTFVMLTLNVPQKSSVTLNECFDGHFKREIIDDYKCDRCRLEHAISVLEQELARERSSRVRQELRRKIERLQRAIDEDPEKPPEDIRLPDIKLAPARKIERHVKMTQFPQILVVHLSRSVFDIGSIKNLAKVSFPERLPLGGLLDRRNYKLLGMISHKGTHNSGHYECFRRQHVYAPFSTPHTNPEAGPYSQQQTPNQSTIASPKIPPTQAPTISPRDSAMNLPSPVQSPDRPSIAEPPSAASSSPSLVSDRPSISESSTRPSSASLTVASPTKRPSISTLQTSTATDDSQGSRRNSSATATSKVKSLMDKSKLGRRKKKPSDRWWRISDDKIKECKTSDVLGMEREVYLLFYEMERTPQSG